MMKLQTSCSLDPQIDYQRVRHTNSARWLRSLLYRFFVGRKGWPLRFTPPQAESQIRTSPHLYVHLPFCESICPHCPYNKERYEIERHQLYGEKLRREMEAYFEGSEIEPVESLYFGGGTPTATPDLIEMTIDLCRPYLAEGASVGVEVHPAHASRDLLNDLKSWGVTRVSLGVESFRSDLLKLLGRNYTPSQAEDGIRLAKEIGFDCVDVNLICAIPGQTALDTAADAQRCIDFGVDQISAYTLFTFVHTPVGKKTARKRFPVYGDLSRIRALRSISRVCRDGGLERTSPWNFTRRSMSPYSTVTRESYIGFGAGAGSKVDGVFWFNTFSLDAYLEQKQNRPAIMMKTTTRIRRFHWLYWQLYGTRIDPERYAALFQRSLQKDFWLAFFVLRFLRMMKRDGPTGWRVTEFGAVWMHRIQQLFSITYIDEVWAQCRAEAWPEEVVLS